MSILSGLFLSGLGVNPRKYRSVLVPEANTMRWWQQMARPEVRAKMKKLPLPVLESLFRRLRRWTWYRDINGERYYLLYRGVQPQQLDVMKAAGPGAVVEFPTRTSFTVDAGIAVQFRERYGTKVVGAWVPESAIVTAPFAFGAQFLSDYDHGELEIIVDPFKGVVQDIGINRQTLDQLFAGWMGNPQHPWFIESEKRLALQAKRLDEGKDTSTFTLKSLNPQWYRVSAPTPDAKTSRGF